MSPLTAPPAKKNVSKTTINLRINVEQRDVIDSAAGVCGKDRTAFMVDAAYKAAVDALLDQSSFSLDDDKWDAFVEALDSASTEDKQLTEFLEKKSPWE